MRAFIGLLALIALIASPSFVTDASAGTLCPTDVGFSQPIWDNVTPNSGPTGCQLGSANNDSATQVNLDLMFGTATWQELAREDLNLTAGKLCADPSGPDCDNSDAWDFTGLDVESLMLVLKGGNSGNTEPGVYVGYLIPVGTGVIDFTTPFLNTNNGRNGKDVSHYTLYWSEDGDNEITEVPEPATLLLVGGGLMAAVRRRRAKR